MKVSRKEENMRLMVQTLLVSALLLLLTACGGNGAVSSSGRAIAQILTVPNVGVTDLGTLDPALAWDRNSSLLFSMLYNGLVRLDKDAHVIPDQATWQISDDQRIYTFALKPHLAFSDGTAVTAQTYVYTWTRALLPELASPFALDLEQNIVGAQDVAHGSSHTLTGVQALDDTHLQVTLTQPASSFLATLTQPLFFPLNAHVIERYGQHEWSQHSVGQGMGTGAFMIGSWTHAISMHLLPNPHYANGEPLLRAVEMPFVADPQTAYYNYSAGHYSLMWNFAFSDWRAARGAAGFTTTPLWQTEALFFDTSVAPFDTVAVRQAFSLALDRKTLAHNLLLDSVTPAYTLLSPGLIGYRENDGKHAFDSARARTLWHMRYPDRNTFPTITLTYPAGRVDNGLIGALQQMWQRALSVDVKLRVIEPHTYDQEMEQHLIPFGFTSWMSEIPDPAPALTANFLSTAPQNKSQEHNVTLDALLQQAASTSPTDRTRPNLYTQAEQQVLTDGAWIPLYHPGFSAILPPWLHGVSLLGNGLYFGTWSTVYLTPHT